MIKRLPMILFILTIVSCAAMVLIRIGGAGLNLLSAKTGTGRFIAATYHSCIVVFAVIFCLFIVVTAVLNHKRKKKKTALKAAAASTSGSDTAELMPFESSVDRTDHFSEATGESEENRKDPSAAGSVAETAGPDEPWDDTFKE